MRKRKYEPVIPRGKSIDVKLKIIELDRNIGHNSVMSICEFFIDRYDPDHLVDQVIHDMEGIGDTSTKEANRMGQLFVASLSINRSSALSVSVYFPFIHGYDM